jgi:hypothetical protein
MSLQPASQTSGIAAATTAAKALRIVITGDAAAARRHVVTLIFARGT